MTGAEPRLEAACPRERILLDADQSRPPDEDRQTRGADRILAVRPAHHPAHPGPGNRPVQNGWGVWAAGHPGSFVPDLPGCAEIPDRQDPRVCDRKSDVRAEHLYLRQTAFQEPMLLRPALRELCTPGEARFEASPRDEVAEAEELPVARAEVLPQPAWRRRELVLEPFPRPPEPEPLALVLPRRLEPRVLEAQAQLPRVAEAPAPEPQPLPRVPQEVLAGREQGEQTPEARRQQQPEQEAPAPGPGAAQRVLQASPASQRCAEVRAAWPVPPAA